MDTVTVTAMAMVTDMVKKSRLSIRLMKRDLKNKSMLAGQ